MQIARDITLLWTLFVFGCATQPADPPALPDPARFVPPAVTLPEPSALPPLVGKVSPVDLPPEEALALPRPALTLTKRRTGRRSWPEAVVDAARGSLLTPTHGGFAQATSAVLRYPYQTGKVYLIPTAPDHPTTLLLPPTLELAAPPILDTSQETGRWDVGYARIGADGIRQEAIMIRPLMAGLEATTPLMTKSGHLFLVRLRSQAHAGVLAVTWEVPLVQVLGDGKSAEPSRRPPRIDLDKLHIQYAIEPGKRAVPWTPAEAYDDGRVTVVRFPQQLTYTSAPVLVAVAADGKKLLPIEYTTYAVPGHPEKGEFYVTRGLYPRLQLRDRDGGLVTIVRQPTPEPGYAQVDHAP